MSRLRRLLALPRGRRALLLASARALVQAAWRVRRWPFSRLAATLGSPESPTAPGAGMPARPSTMGVDGLEGDAWAADVQWAIAAWARVWPWPPTCLMQAVAARDLLVGKGLPCDLYFGVRGRAADAASAAAEIGAHAWLRYGALTVTGEAEAARFQPIAVYRHVPAGRPQQP